MSTVSHQTIRQSVLDRIQSGEWALGSLIPGETELAKEYGCARTTVNRALRTLADEGLVIRKRKGGTRISAAPVRHAKVEIPIIREQVEANGKAYQHRLLKRRISPLPEAVADQLKLPADTNALQLTTLHLADGEPFALEERWINMQAVPSIVDAPLDTMSANEWLVKTVPFSSGEVTFSAINAAPEIADPLGVDTGTALFVIERTTWLEDQVITTTKLYHRAGHQLTTQL